MTGWQRPPPVRAVGSDGPPALVGQPVSFRSVVDAPDELGQRAEGRIRRVDNGLGDHGCDPPGQPGVADRLLQPVAEQTLCLGHERVERIGRGQHGIALALDRQHPDLRAVAVHDEQFAAVRQSRQTRRRLADVAELNRCVCGLTPTQQRVATETDDDPGHPDSLAGRMW